jgi:hypothetical protein
VPLGVQAFGVVVVLQHESSADLSLGQLSSGGKEKLVFHWGYLTLWYLRVLNQPESSASPVSGVVGRLVADLERLD